MAQPDAPGPDIFDVECNAVAQAMIIKLAELAGHMPRPQCVAIMAGTYAAVAVACGLSRHGALELVKESLNDILAGEERLP